MYFLLNMFKHSFFNFRVVVFPDTKPIACSTTCSRPRPDLPWPLRKHLWPDTATAFLCLDFTRDTSTATWSSTRTTATAPTPSSIWSRRPAKQTNFYRSLTRPRRGSTSRRFRLRIGRTRLRWWTGPTILSITSRSFPAQVPEIEKREGLGQ